MYANYAIKLCVYPINFKQLKIVRPYVKSEHL